MPSELLKKESPKSNVLLMGDKLIRTSGNITFDPEDTFHSPPAAKPELIDEAISAFINGYKKYSKSNGGNLEST